MSVPDTLSHETTQFTGTPGPDVTHWGIWRLDARGKDERLTSLTPSGVHADLWPLSELSVEEVRNRWGAGEFRCFWLIEDPENPQPEMRRRPGGRGRLFKIAGDAKPVFSVPTSPGASPAAGAFGEFERAITLMGMIQQMSNTNRQPAIIPDERNVDLAKQVAKLEATIEGDRRLRDEQEKHAKEVRRLEEDVREERMRRRRAEEDRENGNGITLRDGEGIWTVVKKHVAANPGAALKQLADVFRGMPMLVGVVQEAIKASQAPPPSPPPPQVAPAPIARPRAVPSHLRPVPDPIPTAAAPTPVHAPAPEVVTVPTVAPLDMSKLADEAGSPRVVTP